MSANSVTNSAAPSVQKWVVDEDVVKQLLSYALQGRLRAESDGSIELYLRCPNLTATWVGGPATLRHVPLPPSS